MRLATTMKNAASMVKPMILGRSWAAMAVVAYLPRPWREKAFSVRMAPPTRMPTSRPKMVTIGVSAARRPCLPMTTRSFRPLALAVRM